jgi:hypothetical protein
MAYNVCSLGFLDPKFMWCLAPTPNVASSAYRKNVARDTPIMSCHAMEHTLGKLPIGSPIFHYEDIYNLNSHLALTQWPLATNHEIKGHTMTDTNGNKFTIVVFKEHKFRNLSTPWMPLTVSNTMRKFRIHKK